MDRRAFVFTLALCGTGMRRARAQAPRPRYRIGIIGLGENADLAGATPRSATQRALLAGLQELGYAYGEHFVTEARGSGGNTEAFPTLAAELIEARVDVVVATGAALPSLKRATSTIPIVMAATSDPVRQGLVQSLRRPGGNITGLSLQAIETTGKRLELLRELVPGTAPLAVIWNTPGIDGWQAAERAAAQRGWPLLSLEVDSFDEIERVLRRAVEARAGGALMHSAGIVFPHRARFAELAARNKLPVIYDLRPYVEAGGLISYGPDIDDIWRRAATYVDRILKGARPADLPIEQPTKFELVINQKAAKELGLTVPTALLQRADDVIH